MTAPIHITNPGQRVQPRIVRVVRDGKVLYVPESCASGAETASRPAGLRLKRGMDVRIRWPDASTTRQLLVPTEHIEEIEGADGAPSKLVTSELWGFWREVRGCPQVRGWQLPRPMVWIELDGLCLDMAEVELRALEAQYDIQAPSPAPLTADPGPTPSVAGPTRPEDANGASGELGGVMGALERLNARLDALEQRQRQEEG